MLGNLGLGEILIIMVLILVLFGPKKIPELAGTVGRYINQFRRQMEEAQRAVMDPIRSDLAGGTEPGGYQPNAYQSGGYPLGGYPPSGPAAGTPTQPYVGNGAGYAAPPVALTEEEERARQPKRLLD